MENEKEKLISIEDLIMKAKAFGVDFGKGDPKNRLRYYVKLGLLPHAKRKSFNGLPPEGCYPIKVLSMLIDIDRKIKEGKSVLEMKRELTEQKKEKSEEKKSTTQEKKEAQEEKIFLFSPPIPSRVEITTTKLPLELLKIGGGEEEERVEKKETVTIAEKQKFNFKNFFKKNIFLFSATFFLIIFIFVVGLIFAKNYVTQMMAALSFLDRIFKKETIAQPVETETRKEFFLLPKTEPYLTVNADIDVNGKLTLKNFLFFEREGYKTIFDFEKITQDRNYVFPDASGTVCLTSGNCTFLSGDVKTAGGTINRLTKFIGTKEIANSSILDNYLGGISIFIDERGNVGIGSQNPQARLEIVGPLRVIGQTNLNGDLNVVGKIQATGDVCTDLTGKKCLSQMITWFYGGGGISGSGTTGYLPIWTGRATLANSIIYQINNKLGVNITSPNEILTIAGALSLEKTTEPEASTGFGKIFVGQNGKLYFKDEFGIIYDLTAVGGVFGSGTIGQLAFWSSTSTISGNSEIFWDIDNKRLGIGTRVPEQLLDVYGTIKVLGFLMPTNAQSGYVLTSDGQGFASWMPPPSGTIPSGSLGYTIWHDGAGWVANNFLYNDGQRIGIGGATSSLAILTVRSSSLSQLLLQQDVNNYLKFSVSTSSSNILASGTLSFDSLSNEIKFFQTSIKKGDKVLRAAIPIFKFPVPTETSTTTFAEITKEISPSQLASLLPLQLDGSQRKFALLLNFADNILTNASSTWRIDFSNQSDIDFEFQGQNLLSLNEGIPHLQDNLAALETDNWILKARVPNNNYRLRIFNIFLLVYDQIQ